jgi:hypothetical protein
MTVSVHNISVGIENIDSKSKKKTVSNRQLHGEQGSEGWDKGRTEKVEGGLPVLYIYIYIYISK